MPFKAKVDTTQINNIKINFILTTARTGSTLLTTMLNMHPNIISTIEEPFAYNLYPKYKKIKTWTSDTIKEFCYDFYLMSEGFLEVQFGTKNDLETLLEANKSDLTVETAIKTAYLCFFPNKIKTEITTVVDKQLKFHLCLKKVAKFYPLSKFIILYRDPRDQALARFKMFEKLNKQKDYYQIAHIWKYCYSKLHKLKNKIGINRFLEIKYEDLVSNPDIELKKICSFLDIRYSKEMLNYDKQVRPPLAFNKENGLSQNNNISSLHDGITNEVSKDKIGFWKKGLKAQEANLIWTVCCELAEKIGYAREGNFIKQKISFKNYLTHLNILRIRMITLLYYSLPISIKHTLFQMKFGKQFRVTNYTSKQFYEKTYYNR